MDDAITFVLLRIFSGAERHNSAQNRDEIWGQAHPSWLHAWP